MGVGPAVGRWAWARPWELSGRSTETRSGAVSPSVCAPPSRLRSSVTHIISAYCCESGLKYGAVTGDLLGYFRTERRQKILTEFWVKPVEVPPPPSGQRILLDGKTRQTDGTVDRRRFHVVHRLIFNSSVSVSGVGAAVVFGPRVRGSVTVAGSVIDMCGWVEGSGKISVYRGKCIRPF